MLHACSGALIAGHASLNASCSLRACLVLPTRILSMVFSCPRRLEPLGSTAFPLCTWGVHRQERNTQQWCTQFQHHLHCSQYSSPRLLLLTCILVLVPQYGIYVYSFVLEAPLRGACSSCVLVGLSPSGGVGAAWVWYDLVRYGVAWCMMWHAM